MLYVLYTEQNPKTCKIRLVAFCLPSFTSLRALLEGKRFLRKGTISSTMLIGRFFSMMKKQILISIHTSLDCVFNIYVIGWVFSLVSHNALCLLFAMCCTGVIFAQEREHWQYL